MMENFMKGIAFEFPSLTLKGEKFSWRKFVLAARDAIWALLMPVIILGSIYSSVFTPTESVVVSVFYGIIVCAFIYREIKPAVCGKYGYPCGCPVSSGEPVGNPLRIRREVLAGLAYVILSQ
jgi:hypothetical protein